MPRAAYCSECACYVWIGKDGGCVAGHPRSSLRSEYDAPPHPGSGAPTPPAQQASASTDAPHDTGGTSSAASGTERAYIEGLGRKLSRVTRRHVLTVAGVLILATLLFPPWIAYRPPTEGVAGVKGSFSVLGGIAPDPGFRIPIGWHFVFTGPEYQGDSIAIDWSRLSLEILLIGAAAALAAYTLPGARKPAASG
jgi:hypothetical protein